MCLIIVSLISMCLGVLPLGFILCGTLGTSWTWLTISFSFGETFNYNLLKKFPHTLSFSLLLLGPLQFNCWCIWYCPRGLWDYPQFFSLFLLYSALQKLLPPFYLPAQSSASDILLLIPSRVFLVSVIVLFISVGLFFNFSRSVNWFLHFLHFVFKVFDHLYYHYAKFFFK